MHRRSLPVLIASEVLVGPLAAQAQIDTTHTVLIRAMKADLRGLAQQQKQFFERHHTYADSVSGLRFSPATGGLLRVLSAGADGWSGILVVGEVSCGVFAGNAVAPNAAVLADGEPGCWFRRRDGVLVGI